MRRKSILAADRKDVQQQWKKEKLASRLDRNLKTRSDRHLSPLHPNTHHYGGIIDSSVHSLATSWQARTCKSLNLFWCRNKAPGQYLLIVHFRQLKNLLTALAQNVHANEKGCGKYIVFEQKDAGNEEADMVLIEKSVEPTHP